MEITGCSPLNVCAAILLTKVGHFEFERVRLSGFKQVAWPGQLPRAALTGGPKQIDEYLMRGRVSGLGAIEWWSMQGSGTEE